MDDGAPILEVGFAIDTGGSFSELFQLQDIMDSVEARVVADAAKIERATSGMVNPRAATAGITSFGNAATRELQSVAKEARRVEQSGEAMVRQLDRQNAAFGKTREELRAMRTEEKALAADRVGNTDLANRLRAAEGAIFENELAIARRIRFETEAAAEAKMLAGQKAAAAAELEAKAVREAAFAYNMFEAAARKGMMVLREQEALDRAAGKDAVAIQMRAETAAARQLADEHGRLAAMVRGSHAAQEADAAAAEHMRASTDPLYAVTKRLNDALAESTRLYQVGATAPAEYARQQTFLTGRMREVVQANDAVHVSARRANGTLAQMAPQFNDIATMAALGAPPFQIFASQFGQIFQVAQQAEGGVAGFSKQMGGLALAFAPVVAISAVAGVAIYRWQDQLNDDSGLKTYAAGLGLTEKEMKKLGDQSITTGDLIGGLWKTISDGAGLDGSGKSIMDALFSPDDAKQVQGFMASIYGIFAGGYDAIVELWNGISATVTGAVSRAAAAASSFFAPVVAAAQWAGNAIGQIFGSIYNWAAGWVKSIAGAIAPVLSAIGQGPAATAVVKAGDSLGTTFGSAYAKRVAGFVAGSNALVDRVGANAIDKAQERLKKKADEIKADRTAKTPKADRHGEQLVRDAAAIEAQIRNLYKLADAYGVSGAAALIAEARVKAESQAIKQRGDIDAAVDRQVRLAIAQRVSDAGKATATMREQALAQEQVNALVTAGLVPAGRAGDLIRDQIANLPLLAAVSAAWQRNDLAGATRATQALNEQRGARERLTAAEATGRFNSATASGADRLAELREEMQLIGETDAVRIRALATLKATQEARQFNPEDRAAYIAQQVAIADGQIALTAAQDSFNASLTYTANLFDTIDSAAQSAARGMSDAFGSVGASIGDALTIMTGFYADQASRQEAHAAAIRRAGKDEAAIARENRMFAIRSSSAQIGAFGDMTAAAKGFFKQGSAGYDALATAEKVFRTVQFAMSARAIAQDAIETGTSIANSVARTAVGATEAVVNAIKSLPFPLNIAAGAATVAALASIGVSIAGSFGGSKNTLAPANTGTGTVLGDSAAKSESITRAIDALREVDTLTNTFAREMAGSLRSIDSQIGGVAALVVRTGNIDASTGVTEGFKTNAVGSILKAVVPVFGGLLSSLFGSTTSVIGSGLSAGPQALGSILNTGFDASYYSDIEKKKKLFGITTGKSYSTQYTAADPTLENQFTLILREFNGAIAAAAGPLGVATDEVQSRLNGFVVNIGKIDTKGLTGEAIQEKLTAVFGAAADSMANTAFPGIVRFQKVGEGAFETLVRVTSTVEAVTASFDQLGFTARALGIDAKMGVASQFESVSAMTSAAQGYFEAFYSKEEQAAAKAAQFDRVFGSLALTVPGSLSAFRQLVEAQDLTSAAGQATYATLLQLAPAFADLQSAMEGAKSAADIASERQDIERRLLELAGNTAAIRALDLAKIDVSNRALQEQVWAIEDAQKAAEAADQLRAAWASVGDSIADEVRRIRGLADSGGSTNFATLQGQFNAASAAARGGDMDAAKSLPGLSQGLLSAAALVATSRQELDRVQAQTATSLETTNALIAALKAGNGTPTAPADAIAAAVVAAQASSPTMAANDDMATEIRALREEVASLRRENNAGHAATAGQAGRAGRVLEDVTSLTGGDAIAVASV